MDVFKELRRRERAQDALRRIYQEGTPWTGTGEPTKYTRTSQPTTSSSFCDEPDTSGPMESSLLESGAEPSCGRTAQ